MDAMILNIVQRTCLSYSLLWVKQEKGQRKKGLKEKLALHYTTCSKQKFFKEGRKGGGKKAKPVSSLLV